MTNLSKILDGPQKPPTKAQVLAAVDVSIAVCEAIRELGETRPGRSMLPSWRRSTSTSPASTP